MDLRAYLKTEGLTLTEFGERISVSHATISRIITGKRRPSFRLVERIERQTKGNVSRHDLLPEMFGPSVGNGKRAA